MSDSLRRTVHKGTTKIERHHMFAKHLTFGGDGLFRTNIPADHEKGKRLTGYGIGGMADS
jgi:hypothetical protein